MLCQWVDCFMTGCNSQVEVDFEAVAVDIGQVASQAE